MGCTDAVNWGHLGVDIRYELNCFDNSPQFFYGARHSRHFSARAAACIAGTGVDFGGELVT
jgi:hypothetical protein